MHVLFLIYQLLTPIYAQNMTLDSYRSQVAGNDPGYEGSFLQKEGAVKAQESQDALTDTQIFLNIYDLDDMRPTQNPDFQGTRTNNREISLGILKQTEWGPSFKISQNALHNTIHEAQTVAVPTPNYYDVYSDIQATIPLWRNLFGAETKAELKKTKADRDIKRIGVDIQWIKKLSDIDMAYYTHAANQENVKIQSEILDRAEKILSWAKTQRSRGLLDATDVYQAQAAVTLRKLELENMQNELLVSARKLNDLRGIESGEVKEVLQVNPLDLSQLLQSDKVNKIRKDDQIELAQMEMQEGEFISLKEKANPNLDIVLKSSRYGRDLEYSDANDRFQGNSRSLYYVGLNFSMPLNAPKYIRIRKGLRQLARGQTLLLQAKQRNDVSDWKNFVDLGKVLHSKIEMLRQLEQTQKMKSDAERVRIQRGRSTTFQVLTFEQDYISARSQRILAELGARQYITQLPLFE